MIAIGVLYAAFFIEDTAAHFYYTFSCYLDKEMEWNNLQLCCLWINMTVHYIYITFLFDDALFNTSIYVH